MKTRGYNRRQTITYLGQALFVVLTLILNLLPLGLLAPAAYAANGDFSLDFIASAPFTYDHLLGGGSYDDRTIVGGEGDVVEQLEGGQFACGDIVSFMVAVTVDDTQSAADDAPQTIEMDFSFLADTTGQSGVALGEVVGVRANYGVIPRWDVNGDGILDVIGDGPGETDAGMIDDLGSTVTLLEAGLTGPLFQAGSELHATVELDDLERAEQVIVRIDVKLFCDPGSSPTGNLQGALTAARLTATGAGPVTPPEAIPGGEQTIPFKQVGNIATPALDIVKTVMVAGGTCGVDDVDVLTVDEGDYVEFCYVVSNPGEAPLYNISDIADDGGPAYDPFFVSIPPQTGLTDEDGDGQLDDLAPGAIVYAQSSAKQMTALGTNTNIACVTGEDSPTAPSDTYEACDPATVIVERPPTAVELASFTAKAIYNGIRLDWETAMEINNLGFNLYRAESERGLQMQINSTLIPSKAPGSMTGAVYRFVDTDVKYRTTYYYWLESVDIYGRTTRYGPVVATYLPRLRPSMQPSIQPSFGR